MPREKHNRGCCRHQQPTHRGPDFVPTRARGSAPRSRPRLQGSSLVGQGRHAYAKRQIPMSSSLYGAKASPPFSFLQLLFFEPLIPPSLTFFWFPVQTLGYRECETQNLNTMASTASVADTAAPKPKASNKVRKRAPKACLSCRSRKVRCDVSQRGRPCMNCYLDSETCVVTGRASRL